MIMITILKIAMAIAIAGGITLPEQLSAEQIETWTSGSGVKRFRVSGREIRLGFSLLYLLTTTCGAGSCMSQVV